MVFMFNHRDAWNISYVSEPIVGAKSLLEDSLLRSD